MQSSQQPEDEGHMPDPIDPSPEPLGPEDEEQAVPTGPDRYRHLWEPPTPPEGMEVRDTGEYCEVTELLYEAFAQFNASTGFGYYELLFRVIDLCYREGENKRTTERLSDVVTALSYLVMRLVVSASDPQELQRRVADDYIDEILPELRDGRWYLSFSKEFMNQQINASMGLIEEAEEDGEQNPSSQIVLTDARIVGFFESERARSAAGEAADVAEAGPGEIFEGGSSDRSALGEG